MAAIDTRKTVRVSSELKALIDDQDGDNAEVIERAIKMLLVDTAVKKVVLDPKIYERLLEQTAGTEESIAKFVNKALDECLTALETGVDTRAKSVLPRTNDRVTKAWEFIKKHNQERPNELIQPTVNVFRSLAGGRPDSIDKWIVTNGEEYREYCKATFGSETPTQSKKFVIDGVNLTDWLKAKNKELFGEGK